MTTENTNELLKVLNKYAVPDPKIVGKLPRGGTQLDFVGHADITRILIEIDPHWRLIPIAWENGRPAMNVVNDMATMWFELTLLGTSRLAIGTAKANSPDLDKILYGDALRNGAMRFGISLNLWSKSESWDELDHNPAPPKRTTGANAKPAAPAAEPHQLISKVQITQFTQACAKAGLVAEEVGVHAGVDIHKATVSDLDKLRASYKTLAAKAKEDK
jgi:hypothetical protein